jgi:hypothetical protein
MGKLLEALKQLDAILDERENPVLDLHSVDWLTIGTTDGYFSLKQAIAHVCRDVTQAGSIDEICIHDIIVTFDKYGYKVVKK